MRSLRRAMGIFSGVNGLVNNSKLNSTATDKKAE
jgi:hypothetical protein